MRCNHVEVISNNLYYWVCKFHTGNCISKI